MITQDKVRYIESVDSSSLPVSIPVDRFLEDDDLVVYEMDPSGSINTLDTPTHYTVTDAGSEDGGTVELTAKEFSGSSDILVINKPDITQLTKWFQNVGFSPATQQLAIDKLTLIALYQQDQLDRALQFSYTDPLDEKGNQLALEDRLGKIISFDSEGNAVLEIYADDIKSVIENYSDGVVNDIQGQLDDLKPRVAQNEEDIADLYEKVTYAGLEQLITNDWETGEKTFEEIGYDPGTGGAASGLKPIYLPTQGTLITPNSTLYTTLSDDPNHKLAVSVNGRDWVGIDPRLEYIDGLPSSINRFLDIIYCPDQARLYATIVDNFFCYFAESFNGQRWTPISEPDEFNYGNLSNYHGASNLTYIASTGQLFAKIRHSTTENSSLWVYSDDYGLTWNEIILGTNGIKSATEIHHIVEIPALNRIVAICKHFDSTTDTATVDDTMYSDDGYTWNSNPQTVNRSSDTRSYSITPVWSPRYSFMLGGDSKRSSRNDRNLLQTTDGITWYAMNEDVVPYSITTADAIGYICVLGVQDYGSFEQIQYRTSDGIERFKNTISVTDTYYWSGVLVYNPNVKDLFYRFFNGPGYSSSRYWAFRYSESMGHTHMEHDITDLDKYSRAEVDSLLEDYVQDPDYVATDNNFTDDDADNLDNLTSGTDTDLHTHSNLYDPLGSAQEVQTNLDTFEVTQGIVDGLQDQEIIALEQAIANLSEASMQLADPVGNIPTTETRIAYTISTSSSNTDVINYNTTGDYLELKKEGFRYQAFVILNLNTTGGGDKIVTFRVRAQADDSLLDTTTIDVDGGVNEPKSVSWTTYLDSPADNTEVYVTYQCSDSEVDIVSGTLDFSVGSVGVNIGIESVEGLQDELTSQKQAIARKEFDGGVALFPASKINHELDLNIGTGDFSCSISIIEVPTEVPTVWDMYYITPDGSLNSPYDDIILYSRFGNLFVNFRKEGGSPVDNVITLIEDFHTNYGGTPFSLILKRESGVLYQYVNGYPMDISGTQLPANVGMDLYAGFESIGGHPDQPFSVAGTEFFNTSLSDSQALELTELGTGAFLAKYPELKWGGEVDITVDWILPVTITQTENEFTFASLVPGQPAYIVLLKNGENYRTRLTVSGYTSGSLSFDLGTNTIITVNADGVYEADGTASESFLRFIATSTFTGVVTIELFQKLGCTSYLPMQDGACRILEDQNPANLPAVIQGDYEHLKPINTGEERLVADYTLEDFTGTSVYLNSLQDDLISSGYLVKRVDIDYVSGDMFGCFLEFEQDSDGTTVQITEARTITKDDGLATIKDTDRLGSGSLILNGTLTTANARIRVYATKIRG